MYMKIRIIGLEITDSSLCNKIKGFWCLSILFNKSKKGWMKHEIGFLICKLLLNLKGRYGLFALQIKPQIVNIYHKDAVWIKSKQ